MMFMKLKSISKILTMLLFIIGISGCTMIFMGIKLPEAMLPIASILLIISSIFEFIKNPRLRKAVYPLLIIYFLVVMPIIEKFIDNGPIFMGFGLLGCVITIIFVYKDLMISNKEKKLQD